MKTTNAISGSQRLGIRQKMRNPVVIACLAVFLLSLPGCKKDATTPESLTSDITFSNDSGATIDIYMDDILRNTVASGDDVTIASVGIGTHVFDFKLEDTQIVLQTESIDVVGGTQYYLSIEGPATISVTNQAGEILRIIMDEIFIGDIGPDLTQIIYKVRFGEHVLQAKRRVDGSDVASTTIEVTEVTEYNWTITLQ